MSFAVRRNLIRCGAIAGPLFIFIVLIQDYARAGFDPRTHVLSLLSLGDWGWVQIANFVLAGVLNVLFAIALWSLRASGESSTAGSVFIFVYGVLLVVVGLLVTDPSGGFPPGAPELPGPSAHGVVHALGGLFAFVSLGAGLITFGVRALRNNHRGWGAYWIGNGVLLLLLFFGSFSEPALTARLTRLAVLVGWTGASLIATRLLVVLPGRCGSRREVMLLTSSS
jgi:hypothetical membrane protein